MISINNTLMMVNLSFYMFYISGVDEIEGVIKLISSATYTSLRHLKNITWIIVKVLSNIRKRQHQNIQHAM